MTRNRHTIAHDRAEENINVSHVSLSIVSVISDDSRVARIPIPRIAAACTVDEKRGEESVIALDSGLDNRALQAKFDSRNRNIFLACNIQNNLRGSARTAPFAFVETLSKMVRRSG